MRGATRRIPPEGTLGSTAYQLDSPASRQVVLWGFGLFDGDEAEGGLYLKRHLPAGTLDNARLAVLADALEESGCQDVQILGHLRSGGDHVRGCWALDLLLGKHLSPSLPPDPHGLPAAGGSGGEARAVADAAATGGGGVHGGQRSGA
jgi:hypothetical protein